MAIRVKLTRMNFWLSDCVSVIYVHSNLCQSVLHLQDEKSIHFLPTIIFKVADADAQQGKDTFLEC